MQKLNYEQVVREIENKRRFGNLKGVEISGQMLEKLGHPERNFPIVHIAGTNGKGSVSAFLRSVFEEAGFRTGMFTSPHLINFTERIQAGGKMISREDTKRLGNELLEMEFGVFPTMFDYCLAMALLYFKEQQCDVVILETGLGGRYDSTNACGVPDVTVITKIGFDHMAILGDTLPEIASEKAGIIKKGTTLVLESQEKGVLDVFLQEAEKNGVDNVKVVNLGGLKILPMAGTRQCFSYEGAGTFCMRMLGVHQYENAVAAILAAQAFFEKHGVAQDVQQRALKKGIEETEWMGRMELVCGNPYFLLDGAHNSNGVEALKKSLMCLYPGEKFHFIMGVMADKDYADMIEELLPLALDFKTVTVESERALQGEALAECIRNRGIAAEAYGSLLDVLPDFSVPSEEKTVAFGSLYFIGEIESRLKSEQNK